MEFAYLLYNSTEKCMKLTKFGILANKTTFFVHFNKRKQYFQGVCKNFGNSGGDGGKFQVPILEKFRGEGGHTPNSFREGGMDIF